MTKYLATLLMLLVSLSSCTLTEAKAKAEASNQNNSSNTKEMTENQYPAGSVKVAVETTMGNFTILLYGDTPGHRDNFIKHVEAGDYNGVLFHRVIKDFMVQGGDPTSKDAGPDDMLGGGDAGEPIPAEIVFPAHFHKRGALAAARQGDQVNPERKSSASQFYIVTGRIFSQDELNMMDRRLRQSVGQNYFNQLVQEHVDEIRRMQDEKDREGLMELQNELSKQTNEWLDANPVGLTDEMREAYSTVGGAPHLDNEYTVYGEVISGMDTIDKIENARTGRMDRPVEDIRVISMKVIK